MKTLCLLTMVMAGVTATGFVPPLAASASQGWDRYVEATDRRVRREVASATHFLALDGDSDAGAERVSVGSGAIVVRAMASADADGRSIDVSNAMVHHWRGAVLLKGREMSSVLATLEREIPVTSQEDILRASILSRGPETMTVFLKVRRTRFVTAVYNTEHHIRFHRVSPDRAWSESVATKIAEVADPNTPGEHELAPGQDRGFLWRWNSYWRYEQVPEGVIAECESISLSRNVPFGLRSLIGPVIAGVARESMERTLASLQAYFH